MIRPLVSVVIPAYNSERYIEETIASVLAQSFTDFELLVVDDGSTDGQREKILAFCAADSRVRYIRQANGGVSSARNHGFNLSIGELVAFIDSDDVWLPNNLKTKVDKFNTGDFGLVHSDASLMDEKSADIPGQMEGCEGWLLHDMLLWRKTQVPGPSSILVKRSVLNDVGLFDTNLSTSADHDFFLRVAIKYRIGRVPLQTWKYRMHSANMHKNITLMEGDILYLYAKASINSLFGKVGFRHLCYSNMYLILAASWAGDGKNKLKATYFIALALITHPSAYNNLFIRIKKRWSNK